MVGQRQYWVVSPNVDGTGKNVDEWKREGSISREDIRMAVGQLLDYAFQG